jgi:hypothetical protein
MDIEDEESAFSSAGVLRNIVDVLSYAYGKGENKLRLRLKKC